MKKKGNIFLFTITALACFLVIQPILLDVFAQNNHTYSNICTKLDAEDFSLYNFLLNIDIENLSVNYPDGIPVNEELHNKLIQLIEIQQINEAIDLIFEYSLSLLVLTPVTSGFERTIAHTYSFNNLSHINLSCRRGCGVALSGHTVLSGTVTFNSDGTVIGHGNTPSFRPNIRITQNADLEPTRTDAWWVRSNNNRGLEAHGQLDFIVRRWNTQFAYQCISLWQRCDFAPTRQTIRF